MWAFNGHRIGSVNDTKAAKSGQSWSENPWFFDPILHKMRKSRVRAWHGLFCNS